MAFKKVYNNNPYHIGNIDPDAFRKVAMKDPKFALGEIIGSALAGAYANNYNNRGINKAVDKALQSFGTTPVADEQAALQQVQQNGTGAGLSPDMDALNNVRQNMGLDAIQPAVSVGDAQTQDPQQMAAMLAQMPGAAIVAKENEARNIGEFDANTALMKAKQQMMKDGRTPYQIEMALEQLQPHFQKMQDDNYRLQAERIMAELGNDQNKLSDADYKQRIVELARLGDYGKNAANVYGKDIITGQQRWNAQQKEEMQNRAFKNQAALSEMRNAYRLAIARATGNPQGLYGNRRTSGNGVKSPLDSAEFKYIDNAINKIAEIPEEDRTPEQKKFYDQFKGLRDQVFAQSVGNQFGYHTPEERSANASRQANFNPNNYDQAVPFFKEFAKRGNYRKEDIARYIRQKYYGLKPDDTSNEFVESIIREL